MITYLKQTFIYMLEKAQWLDEATRENAGKKVWKAVSFISMIYSIHPPMNFYQMLVIALGNNQCKFYCNLIFFLKISGHNL